MALKNISIVGGGLMGAGIAQIFAASGYDVKVFEPNAEVRASIHSRTVSNLEILGGDVSAVERIECLGDLAEAVKDADYVTEAAPEKLELKQSIFADLIRLTPRDCILASNTSVIPITKIAGELETADRIVGTHWWNPPYLIPLVEVVQAKYTSLETMNATLGLLEKIGKAPAYVKKDTPGFVANRLQHALWREAIAMVAEGICDAKTLDDCVKNSFGLRSAVLGPLENADLVGLDLTLDIHKTMMPELDLHDTPHEYLIQKVKDGQLGFKSGEGFQTWTEDRMAETRTRLLKHLKASRT